MKRIFLAFMLLFIVGGGYFMTQPAARPLLKQLDTATSGLQKQAKAQIESARRTALPEPTAPELSRYEKLLCDMANAERRKRGLNEMKIVPALADVARGHSREMAQKNYFSHTSPTAARRDPMDRYKLKYKRSPRLVAENIYTLKTSGPYRLTEADFRRAHEGWMKSPGHRANILRTTPVSPTQIGVG
ncbi:MAG TPA: CAP domain-containing protein, partial [Abditibacteriaceae bacterium]